MSSGKPLLWIESCNELMNAVTNFDAIPKPMNISDTIMSHNSLQDHNKDKFKLNVLIKKSELRLYWYEVEGTDESESN